MVLSGRERDEEADMKKIEYDWDDQRMRESLVGAMIRFDKEGDSSRTMKLIEVTGLTGDVIELRLANNSYLHFELEHLTRAVENYKEHRKESAR